METKWINLLLASVLTVCVLGCKSNTDKKNIEDTKQNAEKEVLSEAIVEGLLEEITIMGESLDLGANNFRIKFKVINVVEGQFSLTEYYHDIHSPAIDYGIDIFKPQKKRKVKHKIIYKGNEIKEIIILDINIYDGSK